MNHWWRAYDDAVDHAKLLLLSDAQHRGWFNLLCLASANGGTLPDMKVMAVKLRMKPAKVQALIDGLTDAKLIDQTEDGLRPHDWNGRQYKSDVSTERVKRFRNAKRNVSETHQIQSTDTEKKDNAPDGAEKYAFESGCIRLNAKNLNQWRGAYKNLDLEAELLALTQWAGNQGNNWFCAVAGALAKRNREIGIRKTAAQRGVPVTPSGNLWPEAIT